MPAPNFVQLLFRAFDVSLRKMKQIETSRLDFFPGRLHILQSLGII